MQISRHPFGTHWDHTDPEGIQWRRYRDGTLKPEQFKMTREGETTPRFPQGDDGIMRRLSQAHLRYVREMAEEWAVLPAIPFGVFFASNVSCYTYVKRTTTEVQLENPEWGSHIGVPGRYDRLFQVLQALDSSADRWYIVSDVLRVTDPAATDITRLGIGHVSSPEGTWLALCAEPFRLTAELFQHVLRCAHSRDYLVIVGRMAKQAVIDSGETPQRPADRVAIEDIATISAIAVPAYDDETFIVAGSDPVFEQAFVAHPEWQ